MMKIVLKNDFHNTSVVLIVRNGRISASQQRKAQKALCGIADCTCSGWWGTRGSQDGIPDGYFIEPAWTTGKEDGGYLRQAEIVTDDAGRDYYKMPSGDYERVIR